MLLARDEALPQTRRAGAQTRNTLPLCFPPHDPAATANTGALVGGPLFPYPQESRLFCLGSLTPFRFLPTSSLKFGKDEGDLPPFPASHLPACSPLHRRELTLASKSKVNICFFPVESGDSESRMGRVNRKQGGRKKSHKRHSVQFQGTEKPLDGQLPSP